MTCACRHVEFASINTFVEKPQRSSHLRPGAHVQTAAVLTESAILIPVPSADIHAHHLNDRYSSNKTRPPAAGLEIGAFQALSVQ